MSESPHLTRALGARDGALLTIGAVVGTGIFLTAGEVARQVPHPAGSLLVWVVGGLLTLAGALTYAELGAMLPRAGGLYAFIREAWGPVPAFLYGWTCLLVIMSGGIAAISAGFAEYAGRFVPAWSAAAPSVAGLSGPQWAAALAILVLTAVNHVGIRAGAGLQALFTWAKLAAIAALVGLGLGLGGGTAEPAIAAVPASGAWLAGFSMAMIAALWTYDGWYALTFSAAEVRDPGRNLPRGLIAGVITVVVVYALMHVAYVRALGVDGLAASTRPAADAAAAVAGPRAAWAMTLAVVVSSFGCLAATILYSSRLYAPMAEDGVFFRGVAAIHPRFHTPTRALWLQSAWAVVLVLTGGYNQLFTYVTFGGVLFHVIAALALFRLRAMQPERERPYRAWGYPLTPALFVAGMVALTASTLWSAPRESLLGLLIIAAGLPAYAWWRRGA